MLENVERILKETPALRQYVVSGSSASIPVGYWIQNVHLLLTLDR
jgi:hypothetical protein